MKKNECVCTSTAAKRSWIRRTGMVAAGVAMLAAQWTSVAPVAAQENRVSEQLVKQLIGYPMADVPAKYADIEKAVRAFGDNDIEGASKILEQLVSANPELPPAGVMMANLFVLAQNPALARNALEKAVQDDPADPEAYLAFGDEAFQNRRFAEAELLYEKALETARAFTENEVRQKLLLIRALSGKAAVLETRQYWDQAVPYLEEITQLNPENIPLQNRLGRALFKSNKREQAYELFQRLYEKEKDRVDRPEISVARLFQQEELDANAEQLMNRALQRDPNTMRTQLSVAQWALETGRVDLAKQCAAAAKNLQGNQTSVDLLEGVLARYDKNYTAAEEAFQRAHLAAPSNPVAINQLAVVLIEQPDEEKKARALEYAQLNVAQFKDANNPSSREAAVTHAWVLYKLGRVIEAERIVLQTVQQTKLAGDSAYFAAVILNERNRADVARQVLEPAIDRKSVFPCLEDAKALLAQLAS